MTYFSPLTPFIDAYVHADWIGQGIFLGLFLLSIATWAVLIHSLMQLQRVDRDATKMRDAFAALRHHPLALQEESGPTHLTPFTALYHVVRDTTMESLEKNHQALQGNSEKEQTAFLSASDMDLIQSQLATTASREYHQLQRYLYILSTIVSLAPFLGLLGTVWGILTTFSDLQAQSAGGASHQAVLHGLSLALATTVVGLLDAIPALIGYNYLKQRMQHFAFEMEDFSQEMLSRIELNYRTVDVQGAV